MVERGDTTSAARGRRAVARLRGEARLRVAGWAVLLAVVPTVVIVWAFGLEPAGRKRRSPTRR